MVAPSGAPEARGPPEGPLCAGHRPVADAPAGLVRLLPELQRKTARLRAALGSAINRKEPPPQAERTTGQVRLPRVRSAPRLPQLPKGGASGEGDEGSARSEDAGQGLPGQQLPLETLHHPAHLRSPVGGSPQLPRLREEGSPSEEEDPTRVRRPCLVDGRCRASEWTQQELPTLWEALSDDEKDSPGGPRGASGELSRQATERTWHPTKQAALVGSRSAPKLALRPGGSGKKGESATADLLAGPWDAGQDPTLQGPQIGSQSPWTAGFALTPEVWSGTEPFAIQPDSPAPPQELSKSPGPEQPILRRAPCAQAWPEEDHDNAQQVACLDVPAALEPQAQMSAAPPRPGTVGRAPSEQRRAHGQPDQPAPPCQLAQPAHEPPRLPTLRSASRGAAGRSAPTGPGAVAPPPRDHRRPGAQAAAHGWQQMGLQDGATLWCSAPPSTQCWHVLDCDFVSMSAAAARGQRSEPPRAREHAGATASPGLSRHSFPRGRAVA
ncbi:unnamed protein product [Prorocentrum cordatum]|uniref:Uncharacterized protein n=1 Tax=Prorocentrum cordatum TaxID=2364126 RepID=A0ABN9T7Q6_9DINO|nr:unnamed protein product [Polarella glacialis]